MQKKIIFFIVLILIFIIYIVFAFKMYGKSLISTIRPTYLIVEDKFVWQKDNKNWKDITDFNDLKKEKFNIYYSAKNQKTGYVNFRGNKTYVKEKGDKEFQEKSFKAAISNGKLTLADYTVKDIDVLNDYYASLILDEINESILDTFDGKKISLDLDNNGKSDTLYLLSNISLDNTSGFLSKIAIIENDKLKEVINENGIYRYELVEIIDLDNDGKSEIILAKNKKQENRYNTCYQMYSLISGKYKVVKECDL